MAENINGTYPFSTGGHAWQWDGQPVIDKRFGAIGLIGEQRIALRRTGRRGRIVGILKASAGTRAAAENSISQQEATIEILIDSGASYTAEDDAGHTLDYLTVDGYRPQITDRRTGSMRSYSWYGDTWYVWQDYICEVTSLDGVMNYG